MMHCHVCDDDVPLPELLNHARLLHPDAVPEKMPSDGWLGAPVTYVVVDEAA